MKYVCDAPPYTWFRIETAGEATLESQLMNHAVERHFRMSYEDAERSFVPPPTALPHERNIGLKAHILKVMPLFLTLRDNEGKGLVTAMLPPAGREERTFRPIIVGHGNADPYPTYGAAIKVLAAHLKLKLDPDRCFPYKRG